MQCTVYTHRHVDFKTHPGGCEQGVGNVIHNVQRNYMVGEFSFNNRDFPRSGYQ